MEEELNTLLPATEAEEMEETVAAQEATETPQEETGEIQSYYKFNPLQVAFRPFLEQAKAEDPLFALEVMEKESRTEKPKSFAECCEYILGEAYEYASKHREGNFGLAGMPDEDIPGLIKHYYDEDDIVIRKVGGAKVKVAKTAQPKPKKEEKPKVAKVDFSKPVKDKEGNTVTTLKRNGQTFQITEFSMFGEE